MLRSVVLILFVIVAIQMTFLILLQSPNAVLATFSGTKAEALEGVSNPISRAIAWLSAIFFGLGIFLGCI